MAPKSSSSPSFSYFLPSLSSLPFIILSILILSLLPILLPFLHTPSSPYMDEPFHVGQTFTYCLGKYSQWDPKITTLPGLYLPFVLLHHVVNIIYVGLNANGNDNNNLVDVICRVEWMRIYNFILGVMSFIVIYHLIKQIYVKNHSTSSTTSLSPAHRYLPLLHSLTLFLFPLHFFYHFLYYTDTLSTVLVLLSIYYSREHKYYKSAIFSLCSILVRQNNICWTFYVMGEILVREIYGKGKLKSYGNLKEKEKEKDKENHSSIPHLISLFTINHPITNIYTVLSSPMILPYFLFPISAFISFFILNGFSLTVGDSSNHSFSIHTQQLAYFALIIVVMNGLEWGVTYLMKRGRGREKSKYSSSSTSLLSSVLSLLHPFLLFLLLSLLSIHFSTVLHPFLLSDNRHYSFYLFRYFIIPTSRRYMMSVVYATGSTIIYKIINGKGGETRSNNINQNDKKNGLSDSISITSVDYLIFLIVIVLLLVPSPLFEFRYFILPFIVFKLLHIQQKHHQHISGAKGELYGVVANLIFYMVINVCVLYIFWYRPFKWVDGTEARFMY